MPVGFKHSWLSTSHYLLEKHKLCDGDSLRARAQAREAAANLVLSTVLPHSVRMGTRVLETLDNMREILSYDSIGCKQALPIFEELVKAGQEPVGEDDPPTDLEHRLVEWLDRRAAAPDAPPVKCRLFLLWKSNSRSWKASRAPAPVRPTNRPSSSLAPRAAWKLQQLAGRAPP